MRLKTVATENTGDSFKPRLELTVSQRVWIVRFGADAPLSINLQERIEPKVYCVCSNTLHELIVNGGRLTDASHYMQIILQ